MSIPAKGTPEYALWVAAIDAAIEAPFRQTGYATSAKVSWRTIHELREALAELGIDWRAAKKKHDAAIKEAQRVAREKRAAMAPAIEARNREVLGHE